MILGIILIGLFEMKTKLPMKSRKVELYSFVINLKSYLLNLQLTLSDLLKEKACRASMLFRKIAATNNCRGLNR